MATRDLTSKHGAAGPHGSQKVIGSDSVTDQARWTSSEIWKEPWIDVDALIRARLETLRDQDRRRGDRELEYEETNRLHIEFPSEFDRICQLIQDAAADDLASQKETIELNLSEVVHRHRNRHSRDHQYFQRISAAIVSAKTAADHIDKLVNALISLDDAQRDAFMFTANTLSLGRFGDSVGDFARHILEAQLTMHLFSKALHLSTPEPFELHRRGRPPVPFVLAASELVDLWETLTDQKALYPKGSAKGKGGQDEAVQPSTEFVRLSLKIINSNITTAQAITCLKRVFEINKGRKEDPYTRENALHHLIQNILESGSSDAVEKAYLERTKKIAGLINPNTSV